MESIAVASSSIGTDQQLLRIRAAPATDILPPVTDARDGEFRCVRIDHHIYRSGIITDVADVLRHGFGHTRTGNVVPIHVDGTVLLMPFASLVLVFVDQFLLFYLLIRLDRQR